MDLNTHCLQSARPMFRTVTNSFNPNDTFTDQSRNRRNTLSGSKERTVILKAKLSKKDTRTRNGPKIYLESAKIGSRKLSASSSMVTNRKITRRSQAATNATSMKSVEDYQSHDPLLDLKVRAMIGSKLFQRDKHRPRVQGTQFI